MAAKREREKNARREGLREAVGADSMAAEVWPERAEEHTTGVPVALVSCELADMIQPSEVSVRRIGAKLADQ